MQAATSLADQPFPKPIPACMRTTLPALPETPSSIPGSERSPTTEQPIHSWMHHSIKTWVRILESQGSSLPVALCRPCSSVMEPPGCQRRTCIPTKWGLSIEIDLISPRASTRLRWDRPAIDCQGRYWYMTRNEEGWIWNECFIHFKILKESFDL